MGDGVEDGTGPVLIATKLRPPAVRDQVVPRERLLERLRTGSGLALSLVACPAGYGKTTLLAAWREAEAARKPVGVADAGRGRQRPRGAVVLRDRGPSPGLPGHQPAGITAAGRGGVDRFQWCCRAW